ncbi:MAG: septation protein SepH [Nocardioides sp.]|uniref:septation protein SepH n=1 Tax=Nocardioides sp. TaxID=35761 RepID=UPI003EFEB078
MPQLTLTGLSRDGKRLLLVDETGTEHTLAVDSVLRAAVRGERDRIGQLEIQMESALRPRDIQARIRAGESPEAVAEAAQTNVERIMPYAAPVLAEREHMAERAQGSSVRRTGDGARILGEAVAAQLRAHNVDPESVEWDAWRREDGRWTLTALYETAERAGLGSFSFDTRGNYVTVDDDDAKWLIGDARPVAPSTPARDDLQAARERRLGVNNFDEDGDVGDDAIELVTAPAPSRPAPASPVETTLDLDPVRGLPSSPDADEPLPWETPAPQAPTAQEPADEAAAEAEDVTVAEAEPVPAPTKKSSRRKGRASVPSWDEIMFGGGGGRSE